MDRRTLAALGLAAGGLSQMGYGVLLGGTSLFALVSLGEGAGLLLAAAGVWQGGKGLSTWVVAGLALAAVCALPWFTTVGPLTEVGTWASVLNNTGSVVAAAAVVAWSWAMVSPTAGWNGVRLGLGLQALGSFVRLPATAVVTEWTFAFTLAFLGFALATATFPPPGEAVPQAKAGTSRAARR